MNLYFFLQKKKGKKKQKIGINKWKRKNYWDFLSLFLISSAASVASTCFLVASSSASLASCSFLAVIVFTCFSTHKNLASDKAIQNTNTQKKQKQRTCLDFEPDPQKMLLHIENLLVQKLQTISNSSSNEIQTGSYPCLPFYFKYYS